MLLVFCCVSALVERHSAGQRWQESGSASSDPSLVPVDASLWMLAGRRRRGELRPLRHAAFALREVKTNKYRPPLFYFIFRPSLVDDLKFISFVWNTQKPKPKTCSLYLYSEKFLVKVLKEGFSSYIGKANHSATLFTVRPHLFHPPEICIFDI
jgi:hypothetical protein